MPFEDKQKEAFLEKGLFTKFSNTYPVISLKIFLLVQFVGKKFQYNQLDDSIKF